MIASGASPIVTHREITEVKGKGSFYIAQYPVRWTAQRALYFFRVTQTAPFQTINLNIDLVVSIELIKRVAF